MLRRSKESPVREPNGIDVNGYDQKYEPKARRRSRESGGVSARRGPKEVPPKGGDEPPRNVSSPAFRKISFSQLDKRISDLELYEGSVRMEKVGSEKISSLMTPEPDCL
jgi:hypothetical protein